jgi:hypothetical protein
VTQLLAVCSTAYPTMTMTDELVLLWKQMLADTDAELATSNLKHHIMTSKFPPTIADIARQPERDDSHYSNYKQLTATHLLQLQEAKTKSVPMPEDKFKEWLKNE